MVRFGEKADLYKTFLGGQRAVKTISATAGNAITNLSPGSGKRWLVLRGWLTLVTDATVATRSMYLKVTDGTNVNEIIGYMQATASETKGLSFGEGRVEGGAATHGLGSGLDGYFGIDPILVEGSDQFRIEVTAGVAGDSYSGRVVVLEVDV